MKKYYIVGKGDLKNIVDDSTGDLNRYFELGWELMITYPTIKKIKLDNQFNDVDVIVTSNNERKFLYNSLFNNVLSWEEFLNLNISESEIVDLVKLSQNNVDEIIKHQDFNENLLNLLKDFEADLKLKSELNKEKFVCLQYRKRNWVQSRNIDDNTFKFLVDIISKKYNLDVYVMGIDSEKFCDGKKIKYVNLQQFTTLINDENCILYFSTMSGPAHLSCYFANKNIIHVINDLLGQRINSDLENHPLYQGKKYNFTNIDVRILHYSLNLGSFEMILLESMKKNNLI
jgi:hypothetical protein